MHIIYAKSAANPHLWACAPTTYTSMLLDCIILDHRIFYKFNSDVCRIFNLSHSHKTSWIGSNMWRQCWAPAPLVMQGRKSHFFRELVIECDMAFKNILWQYWRCPQQARTPKGGVGGRYNAHHDDHISRAYLCWLYPRENTLISLGIKYQHSEIALINLERVYLCKGITFLPSKC